MSRWARPSRAAAPVTVVTGILGIWWPVPEVALTVTVSVFAPAVALNVAKVRVTSVPVDGTAGAVADIRVAASTRLRFCARAPFAGETFIGPVGRRFPPGDRVALVPEHRGVYDSVTADIATAAPFAVVWWTRRVVLRFPSPLHVAPRSGRPGSLPNRPDEEAGTALASVQSDVGQPRGARPYQSGDSRRRVHWGATAHAGELMIRELERPSAAPISFTVDLPPDPREAEQVAERVLGTITRLLREGDTVLLATTEPTGPVVAIVADRRAAGRRLARAVTPSDSRRR